jgi:formylglycine-generating enzyme required for sulfatase activity
MRKLKLMRGGCWLNLPWYCRSAYRLKLRPGFRSGHYGFRVVREKARP